MWVWGAIVGGGVQCRWEKGLGLRVKGRVGIRKTGREVERKRKKEKKIQQKDKMLLFDSKYIYYNYYLPS